MLVLHVNNNRGPKGKAKQMQLFVQFSHSGCEADTFSAEAGERQVVFFWCPPNDDTSCTAPAPSFSLSCHPSSSPSSSLSLTSDVGTNTLTGFSPTTLYNCSVSVHNQILRNISFTTSEDCKFFPSQLV